MLEGHFGDDKEFDGAAASALVICGTKKKESSLFKRFKVESDWLQPHGYYNLMYIVHYELCKVVSNLRPYNVLLMVPSETDHVFIKAVTCPTVIVMYVSCLDHILRYYEQCCKTVILCGRA